MVPHLHPGHCGRAVQEQLLDGREGPGPGGGAPPQPAPADRESAAAARPRGVRSGFRPGPLRARGDGGPSRRGLRRGAERTPKGRLVAGSPDRAGVFPAAGPHRDEGRLEAGEDGENGVSLQEEEAAADVELGSRAASGVLWLLAQRWGVRVSGFATLVVLTHQLSPGEFGVVAAAMTVIPLVYLLADLGFSTYLLQADDVDQEGLSTAFWSSVAA